MSNHKRPFMIIYKIIYATHLTRASSSEKTTISLAVQLYKEDSWTHTSDRKTHQGVRWAVWILMVSTGDRWTLTWRKRNCIAIKGKAPAGADDARVVERKVDHQ